MTPTEFYSTMKNPYAVPVNRELLAGAVPHPDWAIFEAVMPPSEQTTSGGIITLTPVAVTVDPVCYILLEAGHQFKQLHNVEPGAVALIQISAGDRFPNSPIVLCHKDDICYWYGKGLIKEEG